MPQKGTFRHIFHHSWKDVFLASWKKYPSERRPDILSIDLINKEFDPEAQVLRTTRLVTLKSTAPSWLQPILGGHLGWFLEEAIIDMKAKKMVMYSKNLSFKSIFTLEEGCTYEQNKENPFWTDFRQTATASAHVWGVAGAMEDVAFSKFTLNASLGKDIMENAIRIVKKERIKFEKMASEAIGDSLKDIQLEWENLQNSTASNLKRLWAEA
eukprot:TRINITY_DN7906_c0_g1_i1.p1 TRINITY_DN7906_c0_g1~~TRINITY_DN7906_c0_g1_i1.p1  ORF type:complete len:212 (-),score=37.18 TRINITY_DN7906_c0_g1_i1:71-706(-)